LDEQDYSAVLSSLSEGHGKVIVDPLTLRNYCQAFFETNRTVDTCFPQDKDLDVLAFGEALILLWKGDVLSAQREFERLRNGNTGKWLGYLGLFEAATVTGNYAELDLRLKQFRREKGMIPNAIRQDERYFSAVFLLETGKLDQLQILLSKLPLTLFTQNQEWFQIKFRYLWARSKVLDIGILLEAAGKKLGTGVGYKISRADYLSLTKGESVAKDFLRANLLMNPEQAELKTELVYKLLGGVDLNRDQAREMIDDVVKDRGDRLDLMLALAVSLTSFREIEIAETAFRVLRSRQKEASEFTAYYTLQAWNHVFAGRLDAAERELSVALARSPVDNGANWLAYLITKKNKDYPAAFATLKLLFTLDPFNENVVDELIDIGNEVRLIESDPVASQIRMNQKWYSVPLNEKISTHLRNKHSEIK
jgi:tetratricopeptide (TPR) repeat protein